MKPALDLVAAQNRSLSPLVRERSGLKRLLPLEPLVALTLSPLVRERSGLKLSLKMEGVKILLLSPLVRERSGLKPRNEVVTHTKKAFSSRSREEWIETYNRLTRD